MKAHVKMPRKKPELQCADDSKVSGKVSEIAEELRKLQFELGDTIGPLLLLEEALSGDNDRLEVESEDGSAVNFSSTNLASAEIIRVLASKVYIVDDKLDRLHSKLLKALTTPAAA